MQYFSIFYGFLGYFSGCLLLFTGCLGVFKQPKTPKQTAKFADDKRLFAGCLSLFFQERYQNPTDKGQEKKRNVYKWRFSTYYMFGWFKKKEKNEDVMRLEGAVQTGFGNVKRDISNVSAWIKHLSDKNEQRDEEISDIYEELSTIRSELENVKNMVDILGNKKVFKQPQTVFNKQTGVEAVQTPVQTTVQSMFFDNFLDNLSITERAIVWVLLNSELKLSYDDLAAMLGKERATIRGQLNAIKQKSDGLIEEQVENNNKKRFFIPEKVKGIMLKKVKVRFKKREKKKWQNELKNE